MPLKPNSLWCNFSLLQLIFCIFCHKLIDVNSLPLHCLIDLLPPSWAKITSLLTFPQFLSLCQVTVCVRTHLPPLVYLIIISANATAFSITLRANVTQNSSCGNVFPFASVLPSDYSWNHFWILSVMGGLIKTNIRIRLRRSVFKTKRSQNCDVEPFSSLLALDFATICRSSVLLWRIFLDRLSREFPRLSGWTLRDHSKFLSSWQFYLFLSANQWGICHWWYASVDINDIHV